MVVKTQGNSLSCTWDVEKDGKKLFCNVGNCKIICQIMKKDIIGAYVWEYT